jgi:twitching motility protein PilT
MARIDSLLSIAIDQGANELRIGSDREPKMLAYGVPKRLNIPAMGLDMVREMMGEILSAEREEALRARGRLETPYQSEKVGAFQVTLTLRADGLDAVFLRAGARNAAKAAPAPAMTAPPSSDPAPAPAQALPQAQAPSQPRPTDFKGGATPAESLVRLLAKAQALGASDLHLCEGQAPAARIDGQLRRFDEEASVSLRDAFTWEGGAEAHLLRGGSIDGAADIPELGRVRLHLYATSEGPAASIRLLPKGAPSLGSLGLPVPLDDLALLRRHGLGQEHHARRDRAGGATATLGPSGDPRGPHRVLADGLLTLARPSTLDRSRRRRLRDGAAGCASRRPGRHPRGRDA